MTHRVTSEGPKAAIEAAAAILEEAGSPAVGIELVKGDHWRLDAYYDDPPNMKILLSGMPEEARVLSFSSRSVPDNDWVRRVLDGLPPVRAGRFLVVGAHVRDQARPGDVVVEVEAAEAFGTGHHQSTLGCLLAFDDLLKRGRSFRTVIDVGCGSGVLSIAAAKAPGDMRRVTAWDMDRRSVEIARENAIKNGVAPRMRVLCGRGFQSPMLRDLEVDLAFANILAKPLKRLAGDLSRAVRPGGVAILAGLLTAQAPSLIAAYEGAGFTLANRIVLPPWTTLTLLRT